MPTLRGTRRDFAALQARRFQAARLFGRGTSQAVVARELGVSRTTASRWYQAWARVEAALLKGPAAHGYATDLWTLPRIATVIARLTGVRYHPAHVWRILQGLHWSLQRPARQARERDDAAIRRWQRQRWPQVKKTRGAATPG